MPFGRFGFGDVVGDVSLGEEDLPLKVVGLDEVAVYYPHPPDARPHQRGGDDGAQGPAPHHDREPGVQPALSLRPDTGKDDLPGVAVELFHVSLAHTEPQTRGLSHRLHRRLHRPALGVRWTRIR